MSDKNSKKVQKKDRKKIIIIAILFLVIVGLIVSTIIIYNNRSESTKKKPVKKPIEVETIKEKEKEIISSYIDNINPVIIVTGDLYQGKTIKADILVTDNDNLRTLNYKFVEDGEPTSLDIVKISGKEYKTTLSYNVDKNNLSTTYLYVSATDRNGNTSDYVKTKFITGAFANESIVNGTDTTLNEIDGDLIISKPGLSLENIRITGNLYIADTVGVGDVNLNNVTVTDTLYINGGGSNSIHLDNSNINKVLTDSITTVRIVNNKTTVNDMIFKTNSIIDNEGTINNISVMSDITLMLKGIFKKIDVKATANLNGPDDTTKIEKLLINTDEVVSAIVNIDDLQILKDNSAVILSKEVKKLVMNKNGALIYGRGIIKDLLVNSEVERSNINTYTENVTNNASTFENRINPVSKFEICFDADTEQISSTINVNRNIKLDIMPGYSEKLKSAINLGKIALSSGATAEDISNFRKDLIVLYSETEMNLIDEYPIESDADLKERLEKAIKIQSDALYEELKNLVATPNYDYREVKTVLDKIGNDIIVEYYYIDEKNNHHLLKTSDNKDMIYNKTNLKEIVKEIEKSEVPTETDLTTGNEDENYFGEIKNENVIDEDNINEIDYKITLDITKEKLETQLKDSSDNNVYVSVTILETESKGEGESKITKTEEYKVTDQIEIKE